MYSKVLSKTIKAATSGEGVGRSNNYRLAATVFDKKGRIKSTRTNTYKTHPTLKDYYDHPCLHAEAHAIITTGLKECKGKDLLVVRVLANGKLSMAKPCGGCCALIKDVGIRKVWYSDWKGQIVEQ